VECLPADIVGGGVCDTPELWRGAADLCARVRACAGAAESLHTYTHNSVYVVNQHDSHEATSNSSNVQCSNTLLCMQQINAIYSILQ